MNTWMMFAQRMIGAASGIFVAVLFAVPLVFTVYALFAIDFSSNWRMVLVPAVGIVLFGFGVFVGIRNAVRRWREISQLQSVLGGMSVEERRSFASVIVQSDVELCTDESGKTHSLPLNHG